MREQIKKLLGGHKPAYNIQQLLASVAQIRSHSNFLAIAPQHTGANWLGINHAAKRLFSGGFFQIPQHYSNPLLSHSDVALLCSEINRLQFSNVVFNGFPPYFVNLVEQLANGPAQISVVLHGTLSEMGHGGKASESMRLPIDLALKKRIHKLAAVRRDVADFISAHWKIPAYTLVNKCLVDAAIPPATNQQLSIGIFGADFFNKNLHNQVAGALLVPGAQVFVNNAEHFTYFGTQRIEGLGHLSHHQFIQNLGRMHINLHLSFSESWGQVATESLLLGVPCLVSPNTNILDGDDWLKAKLTVPVTDSPTIIAAHIKAVLHDCDTIGIRGKAFVEELNQQADILLHRFLEG